MAQPKQPIESNEFKMKKEEVLKELEAIKEEPTPATRPCPKCGGTMVEASFEILNFIQADFGHNLLVGPHKSFYLNPKRRSQINVYVCRSCGFIELYAANPQGL
ncbi:MAG: hypothetical protein ABH838_05535 [Actinomycetota bacterium]